MLIGSLFICPFVLIVPELLEGGDICVFIFSITLAVTDICWMDNFETEVSWSFYCLQSLYLSFCRTHDWQPRWMVIFLIIPVVLECMHLKWSKLARFIFNFLFFKFDLFYILMKILVLFLYVVHSSTYNVFVTLTYVCCFW